MPVTNCLFTITIQTIAPTFISVYFTFIMMFNWFCCICIVLISDGCIVGNYYVARFLFRCSIGSIRSGEVGVKHMVLYIIFIFIIFINKMWYIIRKNIKYKFFVSYSFNGLQSTILDCFEVPASVYCFSASTSLYLELIGRKIKTYLKIN